MQRRLSSWELPVVFRGTVRRDVFNVGGQLGCNLQMAVFVVVTPAGGRSGWESDVNASLVVFSGVQQVSKAGGLRRGVKRGGASTNGTSGRQW